MTRNAAFVKLTLFLLAALSSLTSAQDTKQSAVPPLPADIPANAEKFSMSLGGNLAGQQLIWKAADGTVHVFDQYNDRGRGPKTISVFSLDVNGIPVSE